MLEQQEREQTQSPDAPSDRNDNLHLTAGANNGDSAEDIAPAPVAIDLELDPVAYRYESWSEMADGWVESVRSTDKTLPDRDREHIRNVTPLVPLEDVETLVEQLIASRQAGLAHERSAATVDASSR